MDFPFLIKDSSHLRDYERGVLSAVRYRPIALSLFQEDEAINSYTLKWYEEAYGSDAGAVGTGGWNNSATTALPVSDAFAARITKGAIIEIEDEQVRVKAVDTGAKTIEVYERGYGSTAAAAHTATTTIRVISSAEFENVVTDRYRKLVKAERTNFVQEFTENVAVSKRAIDQSHKDFVDLMAEEEVAKMDKMLRDLNRAALFGRGVNDTTTGQTVANGLRRQIEIAGGVQAAKAAGTFVESDLKTFLGNLAERGSQVDTLIMGVAAKKFFSTFAGAARTVQGVDAKAAAGVIIEAYASDELGRSLRLVVDPDFKRNELMAVNSGDLYWNPLRAKDGTVEFMKLTDEPSDSSKVEKTLRTQITFAARQADRMGILTI